jgi:hypothetical protein
MVKPLHLVVGLLVIFAAFWAMESRQNGSLSDFARGLDESNDTIILEGCKRGNLRSAYELANKSDGSARARLVKEVLPLVNCEKTQIVGHYTLINRGVQERFIKILVDRHRWPQINVQGQINGTLPLPATQQKP